LNFFFKNSEKNDVLKLINLILVVIFIIIIVAIWSVKQENILVVASSLITVLGVALFAELSILSNITACLILFFQHPIKVGDTIAITQEGKDIEGELIDITYFFVFIKTQNRGILTIPNALLLKSSFLVIEKPLI
jgi:small-conductance mechanosensitive channel